MHSTEIASDLQQQLLLLAKTAIARALPHGQPTPYDESLSIDYRLQAPGASFVTLEHAHSHELRGCIGTLEPRTSLARDVWQNAWSSAFADPRFEPLRVDEWPHISVHISVLSNPEPFKVSSESELLATLQPHVDGLVLEYGRHRATFLPAVWEQLPNAKDFLNHLRAKAGLPSQFWSPEMRWSRYRAQEIGEPN